MWVCLVEVYWLSNWPCNHLDHWLNGKSLHIHRQTSSIKAHTPNISLNYFCGIINSQLREAIFDQVQFISYVYFHLWKMCSMAKLYLQTYQRVIKITTCISHLDITQSFRSHRLYHDMLRSSLEGTLCDAIKVMQCEEATNYGNESLLNFNTCSIAYPVKVNQKHYISGQNVIKKK